MQKWIRTAGVVVSAIVLILLTQFIYRKCAPDNRFKSRLFTYFLSADSVNQLYTGFSLVAVLDFYDKNQNLLALDSVYVDQNNKIQSICYRLYEVGIGYPSLKDALTREGIPNPQILSVNAIDSRVISRGKDFVQYTCDRLDSDPARRRIKLLRQMITDRQWPHHLTHAKKLIAALKGNFSPREDDSTTVRSRGLESEEIGFNTSFFANLKLTFATIGTFTLDRKFLIFFDLKDDFYVRKDIAEVTYGSELQGLELESQPFWWHAPQVIQVSLKEPERISINRHISLLVSSKGFKLKEGKDLENYQTIDAFMLENLNKQLESIHDRAVSQSKQLSRLFLSNFSREKGLSLKIHFETDRK